MPEPTDPIAPTDPAGLIRPKRALISVSDKSGLADFARELDRAGVEIVSTGSTAGAIREAGISVTEVAEVTGVAEFLDGRVKTLHPAIHAGLLADQRRAEHRQQLADRGIRPFEIVAVNLYPFVETVRQGANAEAAVEQIDIGGPAMVRAAAKNFASVAVLTDPAQYERVVASLASGTSLEQRREWARQAFAHTAAYDGVVAEWFATGTLAAASEEFEPATSTPDPTHTEVRETGDGPARAKGFLRELAEARPAGELRYGENAHQAAWLFAAPGGAGLVQAVQHGGKPMSFNNYQDAEAALRAAYDHDEPAVAIVKHAQPCGIAVAAPGAADPIASAHARAHECDPVSAFGGVVGANRAVTRAMAEQLARIFTEVVVAPGFEPEALEVLLAKPNLRVLELPGGFRPPALELRQVSGGVLVQEADSFAELDPSAWELVAGEAAPPEVLADLAFAWRAVRSVKSNAILLARGGAAVGVGMGQVNRVDSCRLAVARAGERAAGSVAASDAFFPFADGLAILLDAGVRAVVQPGGSVRDEEVIAAARDAGVTMYFTGERHFLH